ncbi:MAG: DUF5329 family protein, partial [Betaproteobacteria bacterium]
RRGALAAAAAIAVAFALALPAHAHPNAAAQAEIDHLLEFVAASSCFFVRNGSSHPGPAASAHLADKYRYAKSRIANADDFIRHVATGSSMSGEVYKVRCGPTEMASAVWLVDELRRYRRGAPPR